MTLSEELKKFEKEYGKQTVCSHLYGLATIEHLKEFQQLQSENKKLKVFALKLVENEEELESLDYWAEEYLHAYEQLAKIEANK